jgi:hypothetical protein
MKFFNEFFGVFLNPKQTFKVLAEKPRWVEALVLLLIAWALFAYFTAPYSQKDSIKILEENIRMRERMGEEQYTTMMDRLKNPPPYASILRPFVMAPVSLTVGLLFSSLIMFGLGRLMSTEGKYMLVFSGFLYANFIDKILGNAVRFLLILSKKTIIETSTGLALFFPRMEITSTAYIILAQIDLFQLWMFGIFSYALASIFKIELKKALVISYGFWLLKAVFYIAMGLIGASFMR